MLIWTCRDADLVEFYLNQVQFDDDAWSFIFYPGKRNAPVMLSPLGAPGRGQSRRAHTRARYRIL